MHHDIDVSQRGAVTAVLACGSFGQLLLVSPEDDGTSHALIGQRAVVLLGHDNGLLVREPVALSTCGVRMSQRCKQQANEPSILLSGSVTWMACIGDDERAEQEVGRSPIRVLALCANQQILHVVDLVEFTLYCTLRLPFVVRGSPSLAGSPCMFACLPAPQPPLLQHHHFVSISFESLVKKDESHTGLGLPFGFCEWDVTIIKALKTGNRAARHASSVLPFTATRFGLDKNVRKDRLGWSDVIVRSIAAHRRDPDVVLLVTPGGSKAVEGNELGPWAVLVYRHAADRATQNVTAQCIALYKCNNALRGPLNSAVGSLLLIHRVPETDSPQRSVLIAFRYHVVSVLWPAASSGSEVCGDAEFRSLLDVPCGLMDFIPCGSHNTINTTITSPRGVADVHRGAHLSFVAVLPNGVCRVHWLNPLRTELNPAGGGISSVVARRAFFENASWWDDVQRVSRWSRELPSYPRVFSTGWKTTRGGGCWLCIPPSNDSGTSSSWRWRRMKVVPSLTCLPVNESTTAIAPGPCRCACLVNTRRGDAACRDFPLTLSVSGWLSSLHFRFADHTTGAVGSHAVRPPLPETRLDEAMTVRYVNVHVLRDADGCAVSAIGVAVVEFMASASITHHAALVAVDLHGRQCGRNLSTASSRFLKMVGSSWIDVSSAMAHANDDHDGVDDIRVISSDIVVLKDAASWVLLASRGNGPPYQLTIPCTTMNAEGQPCIAILHGERHASSFTVKAMGEGCGTVSRTLSVTCSSDASCPSGLVWFIREATATLELRRVEDSTLLLSHSIPSRPDVPIELPKLRYALISKWRKVPTSGTDDNPGGAVLDVAVAVFTNSLKSGRDVFLHRLVVAVDATSRSATKLRDWDTWLACPPTSPMQHGSDASSDAVRARGAPIASLEMQWVLGGGSDDEARHDQLVVIGTRSGTLTAAHLWLVHGAVSSRCRNTSLAVTVALCPLIVSEITLRHAACAPLLSVPCRVLGVCSTPNSIDAVAILWFQSDLHSTATASIGGSPLLSSHHQHPQQSLGHGGIAEHPLGGCVVSIPIHASLWHTLELKASVFAELMAKGPATNITFCSENDRRWFIDGDGDGGACENRVDRCARRLMQCVANAAPRDVLPAVGTTLSAFGFGLPWLLARARTAAGKRPGFEWWIRDLEENNTHGVLWPLLRTASMVCADNASPPTSGVVAEVDAFLVSVGYQRACCTSASLVCRSTGAANSPQLNATLLRLFLDDVSWEWWPATLERDLRTAIAASRASDTSYFGWDGTKAASLDDSLEHMSHFYSFRDANLLKVIRHRQTFPGSLRHWRLKPYWDLPTPMGDEPHLCSAARWELEVMTSLSRSKGRSPDDAPGTENVAVLDNDTDVEQHIREDAQATARAAFLRSVGGGDHSASSSSSEDDGGDNGATKLGGRRRQLNIRGKILIASDPPAEPAGSSSVPLHSDSGPTVALRPPPTTERIGVKASKSFEPLFNSLADWKNDGHSDGRGEAHGMAPPQQNLPSTMLPQQQQRPPRRRLKQSEWGPLPSDKVQHSHTTGADGMTTDAISHLRRQIVGCVEHRDYRAALALLVSLQRSDLRGEATDPDAGEEGDDDDAFSVDELAMFCDAMRGTLDPLAEANHGMKHFEVSSQDAAHKLINVLRAARHIPKRFLPHLCEVLLAFLVGEKCWESASLLSAYVKFQLLAHASIQRHRGWLEENETLIQHVMSLGREIDDAAVHHGLLTSDDASSSSKLDAALTEQLLLL